MHLTSEEQALLDGIAGPGVQRAMEIVATLGRIYGAPDLVPVTHVQIAGVSYKNLGDAGVQFLNEWADQGATVRVPTTLNPAGMELDRWQEMGIQPSFAEPQLSAIDAFVKMGVTPTMSCTPYLFPGYVPQPRRPPGLGRKLGGDLRQLDPRRAQQPRGRAVRARRSHRRPHPALRLPPGRRAPH